VDEDILTGRRLKEERIRLHLNQSQLASLGGVSKSALSSYEAAARFADTRFLRQIQENGVDIFYVLTGQKLQKSAVQDFDWKLFQSIMQTLSECSFKYSVNLSEERRIEISKELMKIEAEHKNGLHDVINMMFKHIA